MRSAGSPPRVYRAQKVVGVLQREVRPVRPHGVIQTPDDLVRDVLADYLADRATEVFLVLYVDVRNRVVEMADGGMQIFAASQVIPVAGRVPESPTQLALRAKYQAEEQEERRQRRNPAGLTAKGERMYEQIRRGYEERGEPRAKEIASRTVLARSREIPGLKKTRR